MTTTGRPERQARETIYPRWASPSSAALAVLGLGFGVWNVGVWASHWYRAELAPTSSQAAVQLLGSGNEALVDGVAYLAGAAAVVVLALWWRGHGHHTA